MVWSVVFLCSSRKGATDHWFENEFEGLVIFLHCAHLFWSDVLGLRFLHTFALPGLGVVLRFRCWPLEGSLGLSTSLFFCGVRVSVFECVVGDLAKFAVGCCATSDFYFLTGSLQVSR